MVPELGANRLAFIPASAIVLEYSRDSGSTWSTYSLSDESKINLFNGNGTGVYIGASSATGINKSSYMARVTINTSTASVYTALNKFVIYCSTNGSTGSYCTVQGRLQSNYEAGTDTWTTFANKVGITGWSGYNIINTSTITTYGNTKTTQYGQVRFTFGTTGHSNTNYPGLSIIKIFGFGGVGWTTPSTMAKTGHMYTYDYAQNVTFPAKVTATTFNGKATKDGNGNTITSTYIKELSASGQTVTYTKGDGSTGTITTQDTTYSAGTHISINGTTINASWPTASDSGYAGINKIGTVTGVKVNGTTKSPTDGIVDIGPVPTVVQTTGTSTTNVMSQNSVTNELGKKADLFVKETGINQISSGKSYELGSISSMTNFPTINAAKFTSINDVSQICFKASANFVINMPSTTYLCIGDGLSGNKAKLTTVAGKSYCITVGYTPFGIQIDRKSVV